MRNRKYVEIAMTGRKVFVGASLNRAKLAKYERIGYLSRTGREVILDTDLVVQGTEHDWDNEAAHRIGKKLNERVEVTRL